jgi:hypothetical protein
MKKIVLGIVSILVFSGCSSVCQIAGQSADIVGKWQTPGGSGQTISMTIKRNGTFETDLDGDGTKDIWGDYSQFLDRVNFSDNREESVTECKNSGFYSYKILPGAEISFTTVADDCIPRQEALSVNWKRAVCPWKKMSASKKDQAVE